MHGTRIKNHKNHIYSRVLRVVAFQHDVKFHLLHYFSDNFWVLSVCLKPAQLLG